VFAVERSRAVGNGSERGRAHPAQPAPFRRARWAALSCRARSRSASRRASVVVSGPVSSSTIGLPIASLTAVRSSPALRNDPGRRDRGARGTADRLEAMAAAPASGARRRCALDGTDREPAEVPASVRHRQQGRRGGDDQPLEWCRRGSGDPCSAARCRCLFRPRW